MVRQFIGADIGGTSIKLGIIGENGIISARREISYKAGEGEPTVMEVLISGIHEMVSAEGLNIDDMFGIGVSAAGCINSVTGSVAKNGGNVPNWSETPVCQMLREEFGLPATLANDGNCAVLGEQWIGAAIGCTDVLGITLGTGVGGGIITGGKLLEGSRGYAGEIGHFPTHAGGEHCVCGLDGCYERYASTSALIRKTSAEDPEWNNGRVFFTAVSEGDENACRILGEWIDEISYGIAGLIHIFDPQVILIGGGVSKQEELLIRPLRDRVMSMIMPDFADDIDFRAAQLGNDAGIAGAVRYLMSRLEQ
ncbi:MAG: ROK family protein [Mogibacterium sp.]|nr:ROK family protein [Mogibacterium sp.]